MILGNCYINSSHCLLIHCHFYRIRLLQLIRAESVDSIESRLPQIVNTVHYIENILLDWGTTVVSIYI